MAYVRGPFDIQWGENVITGVEEISVDYSVESTDYDTVQGVRRTIDGVHAVTVELTLLDTAAADLAKVLPQYFVPTGGFASTGEEVVGPDGIIDIVPGGCDSEVIYNELIIRACGAPREIQRYNNVRTEFTGKEYDGSTLRKVTVTFRAEPDQGVALVQMFKEGDLLETS